MQRRAVALALFTALGVAGATAGDARAQAYYPGYYYAAPSYYVVPPPVYTVPVYAAPVYVAPAPVTVYRPVIAPAPLYAREVVRSRPWNYDYKYKVYSPYRVGPVYKYEYEAGPRGIEIEQHFR